MKMILLSCVIFFILNCTRQIDNANVTDRGTKQIGSNVYLKMLQINSDHIYLLVDRNGNLISTDVNSSFYVGKYRERATVVGPK